MSLNIGIKRITAIVFAAVMAISAMAASAAEAPAQVLINDVNVFDGKRDAAR